MGKEAKIGLAVIGVLLAGFGTLLARKLITSENAGELAAPRATQAAAPAIADGKPTVVTAQREPGERHRAPGKNPWRGRSEEVNGDSAADVPRASYLPTEGVPVEAQPQERNIEAVDSAADDAQQSVLPRSSSPFDRDSTVADDEQAAAPRSRGDVQTASVVIEAPVDQPRLAVRNPVRRASAEMPIEETAATPNELAENEAPVAQPISVPAEATIEPVAEAPRDEDAPADPGVDPRAQAASQDQMAPVARPQSDWRGAVEPASSNAPDPVAVENGKYTVQPNDNLWIVSEKVYGTGRYFKAIYEHNRAKLPHSDRLAVGTILSVPAVALLEQNYPALCPKQRKSALVKPRTMQASTRQRMTGGSSNVYVVEEGDTLFDIARYELGKASRWAEIYDLNRDALGEDFDYLQPGTELAMPPKAQGGDSVTRQRDAGIQR